MEQTAALPLTGEELVRVIQDKVGTVLRRDCYLKNHFSYPQFGGTVKVSLWLGGAIEQKKIETDIDLGPKSEDAELREAEFPLENLPPDELRVETGQDVPTLTKDENGRVEVKPVRYARKNK